VPGALGLTQPLFEGCDVGYLDMGTNTGTRIGALYEPQHYPKEQELFKHMDKRGFSREAVCTVAFEPNPVHHLKLRQMAQRYRTLGRRVRILEAAIGGSNSVQRFYSDGDMGEKVRASYWGSSLLMWSAAHSRVADETSVLVPVVSFDWLLQALVLPSPPKKALYAKMDIEGGETAPQAMNPV
jgi:FkbM family methyltransferase